MFDDLHNRRRRSAFWLADEQMNVVGHHDVADHNKLVALTDFLEYLQKQIVPFWTREPGLAVITTTGEEVEIIVARVALGAGGHFLNLFEGQLGGIEKIKNKIL